MEHCAGCCLPGPSDLEVKTMTLWTIYNRHPDPYLAIRSGDDDERPGDRVMTSSDLPALRHRLARLGLSRLPPDPDDPNVILEVWLEQRP
jgi:hypothetical protein